MLRDEKVVPDVQVFRVRGVSNEYGRKVMLELERRGEISPQRTSTGRCRMSFEEAERLAQAL